MRFFVYSMCWVLALSMMPGCGGDKDKEQAGSNSNNNPVSRTSSRSEEPVDDDSEWDEDDGFAGGNGLRNGLFPQPGAGTYPVVFNTSGMGGGLFPQRGTEDRSPETNDNAGSSPSAFSAMLNAVSDVVRGGGTDVSEGAGGGRRAQTVPQVSEYGEFYDKAAELFRSGEGEKALDHVYAYMLTDDEAMGQFPMKWHATIKRPRVALRWGVGVVRGGVTDERAPVIGEPVEESDSDGGSRGGGGRGGDARGGGDPRGGGGRGGDLRGGGGDPRGGGGRGGAVASSGSGPGYDQIDASTPTGLLLYYTGDFGEQLISEFDKRRQSKGDFGRVLKDMPVVHSPAELAAMNSGDLGGQNGLPQAPGGRGDARGGDSRGGGFGRGGDARGGDARGGGDRSGGFDRGGGGRGGFDRGGGGRDAGGRGGAPTRGGDARGGGRDAGGRGGPPQPTERGGGFDRGGGRDGGGRGGLPEPIDPEGGDPGNQDGGRGGFDRGGGRDAGGRGGPPQPTGRDGGGRGGQERGGFDRGGGQDGGRGGFDRGGGRDAGGRGGPPQPTGRDGGGRGGQEQGGFDRGGQDGGRGGFDRGGGRGGQDQGRGGFDRGGGRDTGGRGGSGGNQDVVTFQDHVQPILRQRCASCHNPNKSRGGLDVTSFAKLMQGGNGGAPVDVGNSNDSFLFALITHAEEPVMPPNGNKIPQNEIDLIGKWIDGGALQAANGNAGSSRGGGSVGSVSPVGNFASDASLVDRWAGNSARSPLSSAIGELSPGLIGLGEGSRVEIAQRAQENDVDCLLLIQINGAKRRGTLSSMTRLRLVDAETAKRKLAETSNLSNVSVMNARADGKKDQVADQISKFFDDEAVKNLRGSDMPTMSSEVVLKRVNSIAEAAEDPLRDSVEVIWYYREGLLSENEAIEALNTLLDGMGEVLINGSEKNRIDALKDYLK